MADSLIRVVLSGDSSGYSAAMSGAAADAEAAGARVDSTVNDVTSKTGNLFSKLGSSLSNISPVLGAPFTKLGESFSDAETKGHGFNSVMSTIGGATLLGLGAGLIGAAAAGIHLADEMDVATNKIAANGDISQAAAQKIGNAFLNMGGSTIYSGQEIATAYAGVVGQLNTLNGHALTASQALTVMTAATNLAMASGQSLSSVTSSLSGILQTFQMGVKNSGEASDILETASRATGMSVTSMASSLEKARASAGAANPSLASLAATVLDLQEHGETGRKAVSALSTMITGLLAPTQAVKDAQYYMGISFTDASGKLLPMGQIIGVAAKSIEGMSQQQGIATLKAEGFGASAAKIYDTIAAGPAAYDKATTAVTQHGAAEQAAQKATDNLHDTMEKLKVEIEDLTTKFGEVLMPVLKDVIADVMSAVNWFEKHKDVALALAGVIGGALSVAVGVFAVNKIGSMIQSTSKAITSLEQFGSKAITAAQNMLGLGSQTEATAGEVQAAQGEQQAAIEETAATTTTTTATIQSSLVDLGAAVEALTTQIQAAAAQISTSFGEIGTSASGVAADFSADMTEMEGQLALFRGEAETPIVMPPVVPGGVAGAGVAGAEGAGAGALGGEEVAGGAAAGGGAAGLGSAVLPVAAMVAAVVVLGKLLGGVSPQIKQYTDAVAKSEAAANSAKSVDSLTASLQALEAEQPRATGYIKSGAAAIGLAGTSMQTTSAYYALWTNNMRAAGTAGDSLSQSIKRVLTALASAGTGLSVPQTQAVAKGDPIAQHYLSTIASSMAKDASIKAQATTFAGMLSQLSGLKAGSAQYEQALKGIQQTGDKWYPEFAKDKTAAQFAQTTDKIYAAAVVTNTKLEATVKDQSLKSAESHLASLQSQLSKETTQGASKATLDSTKGLINTELGHIATIHQLTTQLHKDSTAISVGKSLEQVTTKAGTDTQSKLDKVTITKLPDVKLSVAW